MFRPARHYAKVKGWVPKGIASFLVYASLSTVLPFMWDAWHRTMHANDFLWRWFHQMHHSAERVDVAGAFYFSPLDMVGWTFLGSLALVWAATYRYRGRAQRQRQRQCQRQRELRTGGRLRGLR